MFSTLKARKTHIYVKSTTWLSDLTATNLSLKKASQVSSPQPIPLLSTTLGAAHQRCLHSGGEVVIQCGHFARQGGFLRCGRLHFLVKTFEFFKINGVRRVEPLWTLCGQGGGDVNFS